MGELVYLDEYKKKRQLEEEEAADRDIRELKAILENLYTKISDKNCESLYADSAHIFPEEYSESEFPLFDRYLGLEEEYNYYNYFPPIGGYDEEG